MVVHRTKFFLALFFILIIPLLANKIFWLIHSQKTEGIYAFKGGGNALDQIRQSFSVIYFKHGRDTVWFNGPGFLNLQRGTIVPIRYQPANPSNAMVDTFFSIWTSTLIYGGIPLLILFVIFLHPEVVPRQ